MRRSNLSLAASSLLLSLGLPAASASADVGGPDAFGYTYVDHEDGAVYNYVDISTTGTVVIDADDGNGPATLGAPFTAYGETFTELLAGTNGILTTSGDLNASDLVNSCPLPDGTAAASFRVAALHDDLVSTVYYQYFDVVEAAALGYPGALNGISIFQWQGTHFNDGAPVDFEVILFHATGEILVMHDTAGQGGVSSTTGLQEPDQGTGLTYACNTADTIDPGTTAVLFTPPPPPVRINEVRTDQPGGDNDEYFELIGPPGTSLDGVSYLVLGDSPSGEIEALVDLTGQSINALGFYVVAEDSFTLGVADGTFNINFENSDTVTHMLVTNFTGALSDNIDTDQDGQFDVTPWTAVIDTVAIIEDGGEELSYGPPLACAEGPTCQDVAIAGGTPQHVFRCPDLDGTWLVGDNDPTTGQDSPGLANPCACGDGITIGNEECDDAGESVDCDDDCTFVACGDGTINNTAGEECDDSGESDVCDDDCTLAACGDGTVNATAGETCDDGGESVDCNDDCTASSCGDGTLNMTAGEDCDDGGESVDCNDDCSFSQCGDGVTNTTAGEDCDDGGESADCNDDCTFPSCGDGVLNTAAGEECDDGGESVDCDDDCTAATCGDGTINATAGETCDDEGRSAECNSNCTAVSCGDGIVNATAGEACDGDGAGTPGETAECDEDCTAAMCGDTVVNATAGEDCDDGSETEDCDEDCTAVECGDGETNETAGEECDDGNTDDGDGCSSTCLNEVDPGTTGSTGEPGSTGDGDTEGDSSTGDGGDSTGATQGGSTTTGPDPVTTSPSTTVNPSTTGNGGSSDESGDDSGGATPIDEGCACQANDADGSGWALFGLFGLAALGRRRRRE